MIKDRVIELIENKGLVKEAFFEKIGMTSANFRGNAKKTPLNSNAIENILSELPDINTEWLLTGKGNMLKPSNELEVIKAPEGRFRRRLNTSYKDKIAFYESDFEAGKGMAFYDDIRNAEPSYYMDVPDFAGCTAFRTYGKSMQPQIEPGAILFGTKEEDWKEYIEYGQIYGIVLRDQKRLLKQIKKSKKNEDNFLLISANPEFDEFEIPKSKIKNIWLIHGWLNKNT